MNQNTSWTLGAIAILLAALVARGAPPQAQSDAVKAPGAEEKEKENGENQDRKKEDASDQNREVWTDFCPAPCLYQEFFGLPLSALTESWPESAAAIAESAKRQGYALEFLIALVPDPVDSHFSNLFDEALDALQRGLADSGYLFDRVSLPWEGKAAELRLFRWIPGGMLFRQVDEKGKGRLLAVFLVGESPKSGIHKQAFFTALDFLAKLQRQTGRNDKVRILGPSFSGSAESLRLALREWHHHDSDPGLDFNLVTGSATTTSLKDKFTPSQFPQGPKVTFKRTVLNDENLNRRALEFLTGHLGWRNKDIALITEFDTSYGSSDGPSKTRKDWVMVPFPSNVAHIRTAREKLGLDRDPDSSEEVAARKNLVLSLADDDKPVDVVPQFNELSTQASDLALAGLLRRISRKRYIGILASDIQDRLFLAKQVHSFCPDAVIFTFDNHLLDAHPEVAQSMDGTLVLTSFPLFPPRDEEARAHTLRQFTSEFQEGIYRASRELMGTPLPGVPKVWISAVGNGTLWPVASLPDLDPKQAPTADPGILRWLMSALVVALLAGWLWRIARPLQLAAAQPWREADWTRGAVFLPALGSGVLWLASGVLLVFYSLPLWGALLLPNAVPYPGNRNFWSMLVLFALVYVGMAWVSASLVRPPRRWTGALAWIAACVLLPIVLAGCMRLFWLFEEGAAYFYARAGNFSSGLSPLVSLALLGAAAYAWAIIELKRRRLIVAQDLPWPLQASSEPALATCTRSSGKLRELLLERSPRAAFWVALVLLFLLPSPRLLDAIQPIAERRAYGGVFLLAVSCVLILSALSFYRFFVAWRRLESILNRLCDTWIFPVLSRSSDLLDWKPLKSFGLRMPSIKMTVVSARQLRKIFSLALAEPQNGVEDQRAVLDEHLRRLFEAEDGGNFIAEVAARRELRDWFDNETGRLESVRQTSGSADPLPDDQDGKPVHRPREVEMREIETYLAIRVVAYLRYIFAHLRYALVSATICGLTLLLAVSSYAFQPKRFLSFGIWLLLLAASGMTLRAFMQMDRNGTLSAITGTDAGKVSLDRTFFSNLFTYGAVPVLGIVITQLPSVGRLFSGWLGPLLRIAGAH